MTPVKHDAKIAVKLIFFTPPVPLYKHKPYPKNLSQYIVDSVILTKTDVVGEVSQEVITLFSPAPTG